MERAYSTKDVLGIVGISRNTLFLWLKHHKIPEVERDRNGHRIFTDKDIDRILAFKNKRLPPILSASQWKSYNEKNCNGERKG